MLYTQVIYSLLLVSNALASHHYSKRIPQPIENKIDHNNVQDSGDISLSASSVFGVPFPHHRDSYIPPAPFSKQFPQKPISSLHVPINKQLQQEKLLDGKLDLTGGSSVGYIFTAGSREKIRNNEGEAEIAPHASPFAMSSHAKKSVFDKSFKKYRFAYTNLGADVPSLANGANNGSNSTPTTPVTASERSTKDAATAGTAAPDMVVPLTFDALHTAAPNLGMLTTHHKFYTEKTDLYGSKGTAWKQLGPNIEISSATKHIPFTRQINSPKERKKSKTSAQPRKNGLKNVRTGFMTTQQHALYVANNLKGFKGGGSNFDHSNVLRQSDKFEVTDAMISEAEKEEALKNVKTLRVRFREEVPYSRQSHPMPFQAADQFDASPQLPQYYSQMNAPSSPGAAHGVPLALSSFPSQLGTLGRGFVRHIEVEMNGAGGARKMVPALIIPLAEEAGPYNYVNSEVAVLPAASAFVNHPGRQSKPTFPYDVVAPRYVHHHPDAINAIASSPSAENYHLQPFAQLNHYQYKTQLGDESSFDPYVNPHYHNHNLYNTRFAFLNSNGGGATTASGNNGETIANGGPTSAVHDKRSGRHSAPKSAAHTHYHAAKKAAQHLIAEQSEQKPFTSSPYVTSIATFVYDADNTTTGTAQTYLAPSESSFLAAMASTRDETRSSQPAENSHTNKSNVRRNI